MSSTSTNTWFSKIALAQYVVRQMFPAAMTPAARVGDRVHANWQRTPGCGAMPCVTRSAATRAPPVAVAIIRVG